MNLCSVLCMRQWISSCFLNFCSPYYFLFLKFPCANCERKILGWIMMGLCGTCVVPHYVLSTWLPMFLSIWGMMKTQHLFVFFRPLLVSLNHFLSIQMRTSWFLWLSKCCIFFYTIWGPCKLYSFLSFFPLLYVFMCLCLWLLVPLLTPKPVKNLSWFSLLSWQILSSNLFRWISLFLIPYVHIYCASNYF